MSRRRDVSPATAPSQRLRAGWGAGHSAPACTMSQRAENATEFIPENPPEGASGSASRRACRAFARRPSLVRAGVARYTRASSATHSLTGVAEGCD